MKESILEIIVCPVCKGPLVLQDVKWDASEITSGVLYCAKCDYAYPIMEGIPNLLPPEE